jgi:hypothetical protein
MTDFDKWQQKNSEKKRAKKLAQKEKQELKKQQGNRTAAEVDEDNREKDSLALLIGNAVKNKKDKGKDQNDDRFNTLEKDYAVDPTHKEYRKVEQGHNKISKRQRRN